MNASFVTLCDALSDVTSPRCDVIFKLVPQASKFIEDIKEADNIEETATALRLRIATDVFKYGTDSVVVKDEV